jgi:hypothetical protein
MDELLLVVNGENPLVKVCFSSARDLLLAQALMNFVKSFLQQFRECRKLGHHKEHIRKKLTADMMPFCPAKAHVFIKHNITHINLIKCGRFGGTCRSKHPMCLRLRNQTVSS